MTKAQFNEYAGQIKAGKMITHGGRSAASLDELKWLYGVEGGAGDPSATTEAPELSPKEAFMKQLFTKKVDELKALAEDAKVEGAAAMTKAQLVDALVAKEFSEDGE